MSLTIVTNVEIVLLVHYLVHFVLDSVLRMIISMVQLLERSIFAGKSYDLN